MAGSAHNSRASTNLRNGCITRDQTEPDCCDHDSNPTDHGKYDANRRVPWTIFGGIDSFAVQDQKADGEDTLGYKPVEKSGRRDQR